MLGIGGPDPTLPRPLMPGSLRTWHNAKQHAGIGSTPAARCKQMRLSPACLAADDRSPGSRKRDKPMTTTKQERFVREYVQDFNATKAAIRAGYARATASQAGHRNLRKPAIRARVLSMHQEIIDLHDDIASTKAELDIAQALGNPVTRFRAAKAILDADLKRRELDLREKELALKRGDTRPGFGLVRVEPPLGSLPGR